MATAHFDDVIAVLAMAGSVAGVIVGATAGAADIEAGVFRDLVATGRSRLALFFARVPGAWAIVLPLLAPPSRSPPCCRHRRATRRHRRRRRPGAHRRRADRRRLRRPRRADRLARHVIGLALAFQLGVSPLLAQVEALGDARFGIPQVAIARIGGAADDLEFAVADRDRDRARLGRRRAGGRRLALRHAGDLGLRA